MSAEDVLQIFLFALESLFNSCNLHTWLVFVLVFMATVAEYFIPYHEYLRAREKWKFYREQGGWDYISLQVFTPEHADYLNSCSIRIRLDLTGICKYSLICGIGVLTVSIPAFSGCKKLSSTSPLVFFYINFYSATSRCWRQGHFKPVMASRLSFTWMHKI